MNIEEMKFRKLLDSMSKKECQVLGENNIPLKEGDTLHGLKNTDFKTKTIEGRCAFFGEGITNPVVGKKYKVTIGDPDVFIATYMGDIICYDMFNGYSYVFVFGDIIAEYLETSKFNWGSIFLILGEVSVFKQGDNYLFYNRLLTKFEKLNLFEKIFMKGFKNE